MNAVEEIQAAIEKLTALRDAGTAGPFYKSDCEGEIRVFPERLLRNVSRDESGQITSFRSPGSWATEEMVIEYEVESWDVGQDKQDDRMRANAEMFVTLHRTIDAQLAILTAASVDECEWADEWARIGKPHLRGPAKIVPINRAALQLARAINGTNS
ncbi:hypothetical protein E3T54_02780 [Cryobacterium sp. Sr8]|uniref:hypothetical protein n=1 Tax=Cryobacterium sp. Sr8 TaxID=1259203 RepID=UPI00106DC371|nr:hypothetical protein [Cryobacterium sp. Sr8]TFD80684.1 hypothetical protein E3T54_02780 [Cryobacterium sp. Sr8]